MEGDNLEVLRILQGSYRGKVKMIYIDPPYNTGNDFVYTDNFSDNIRNYKEKVGDTMKANADSSGRYHTNWLNMMYPRLRLARNLLKDDGVIFISIDDNEVANLRKVCDEIFGEENFIGDIIWNSTKSVTNTALISVSHTYNLVYAKDIQYYTEKRNEFRLKETGSGFDNPDNDVRGPWKADPFQVGGWRPNQQYEIKNPKTGEIYTPNAKCSWKNDLKKFQTLLEDNRIVFGVSGESGPQRKRFLSEALERGRVVTTLWNDVETTTNGTQSLKKLLGGNYFDNPKPVSLIKRFVELCAKNNDIILDFFSGSGTTAQAVMEFNAEDGGNRKFIMVQIPELTPEDSEARKAGYRTIADIGKERIRRVGEKIMQEKKDNEGSLLESDAEKLDIGFRVFTLDETNFVEWDENTKDAEGELLKSLESIKRDRSQEDALHEILLKYGVDLTMPIKELDILGKKVYSLAENYLLVCLEKDLSLDVISQMALLKPNRVVLYDDGFKDDNVKANAEQTLLKNGVEDIRVI